jgi:aryl-alcohol dehydrogenase-like predicted oxidoreductase
MLSGKYLNDAKPAGARLTLFTRFSRYSNPLGRAAAQAYVQIAQKYSLDPAQMALAYVNSRPFLTSTIIGATTLTQLRSNLASANLKLSPAVLEEIENVHERVPNPCP